MNATIKNMDTYNSLPEDLQHDMGEIFQKAKEVAERHGYKITGDDNWAVVDEAIARNMVEATPKE